MHGDAVTRAHRPYPACARWGRKRQNQNCTMCPGMKSNETLKITGWTERLWIKALGYFFSLGLHSWCWEQNLAKREYFVSQMCDTCYLFNYEKFSTLLFLLFLNFFKYEQIYLHSSLVSIISTIYIRNRIIRLFSQRQFV